MPPRISQPSGSQTKATNKATKSSLKASTIKLSSTPSGSSVRLDPFKTFSHPQSASQNVSRTDRTGKSKGKEKAEAVDVSQPDTDQLWVDIYEPQSEAELAVHPKKVEEVRRWLDEAFAGGLSGKLSKYRRVLALTGPAGTAKTSTIRVLARQFDCEILEWRNAMSPLVTGEDPSYSNADHESTFSKFESFLLRASSCQSIFDHSSNIPKRKRQIILLEDLPNILHAEIQAKFHSVLHSVVSAAVANPAPIVLVVSDVGPRGEASDERLAAGLWSRNQEGVMNIRTILPRELLNGPYVTQINFNPIAMTLMKRALQTLVQTHFSMRHSGTPPSKEMIDLVVETSSGDIRSAIMALQFSCVIAMPRKNGARTSTKQLLQAITRREQGLELFHFIGRVMYNKRKGDPPNPSATAKDIKRDRELDAVLRDPPKIHPWQGEHERRTSRVNVDASSVPDVRHSSFDMFQDLYADSPIDSSLFSLYIHQNYGQFCNEVEQCFGIADTLSWVDSSGGEAWYQANPHQFHLLSLGTLHSLPTPVSRRGQKLFKPEFFDFLSKEKAAWDSVRDVRSWIGQDAPHKEGGEPASWSRTEVAVQLGTVLKNRDKFNSNMKGPASHRLFSTFSFGDDKLRAKPLGEGDELDSEDALLLEDEAGTRGGWDAEEDVFDGGWLKDDEIQDFYHQSVSAWLTSRSSDAYNSTRIPPPKHVSMSSSNVPIISPDIWASLIVIEGDEDQTPAAPPTTTVVPRTYPTPTASTFQPYTPQFSSFQQSSFQYHPSTSTNTQSSIARQAITNNAAQQQGNTGALDTSDVATLNDALGSAGVDLRAEEESLMRSHEQVPSFRPFEDRSRKQPSKPNFDTVNLSATMRTIATQHKVTAAIPADTVNYLALALRARLQDLVTAMIHAAHHRLETQFDRPSSVFEDGRAAWGILVRSDIEKQLAALEKVEREEEMLAREERATRGSGNDMVVDGVESTESRSGETAKEKPTRPRDLDTTNAAANRAAGLIGKYAWLTAAHRPKTGAGGVMVPGPEPPFEEGMVYSAMRPDRPAPTDEGIRVNFRDAMFVLEKERGHGGGRGAARGWT
ncbi:unnamed protein product [Mycena citricolor]|uniref:Transcription initiation factor TFIID subunit 4 n=1 Tax=Mycena citricolor TaxID=2018698 RepID=A0AAD2HDV2_9AGAR|nr:unnamed protein product [Mycena citricolor]